MSDPAAQPPAPPPGYLGVVEIGIALQLPRQCVAPLNEPSVPGVQVVLVDRPIGVAGDLLRVRLDGAPEIGDEPVCIVDRLAPWLVRTVEQYSPAAEKRLDVVRYVAESLPHNMGDLALSAEPRERRL